MAIFQFTRELISEGEATATTIKIGTPIKAMKVKRNSRKSCQLLIRAGFFPLNLRQTVVMVLVFLTCGFRLARTVNNAA